jgi:hypothetical protein
MALALLTAVVLVGAAALEALLQTLRSVVMARWVVHTAAAGVEVVGHKTCQLVFNFRNPAALALAAQSALSGAQDAHFLQLTQVTSNVSY